MRSFTVLIGFGISVGWVALAQQTTTAVAASELPTGVELADRSPKMAEHRPEMHRKLADGTFDALSLEEQLEFSMRALQGIDQLDDLERRAKDDALLREQVDTVMARLKAAPPAERKSLETSVRAKIVSALETVEAAAGEPATVVAHSGASCDYGGKQYSHGSELCQDGRRKICRDGEWEHYGGFCP